MALSEIGVWGRLIAHRRADTDTVCAWQGPANEKLLILPIHDHSSPFTNTMDGGLELCVDVYRTEPSDRKAIMCPPGCHRHRMAGTTPLQVDERAGDSELTSDWLHSLSPSVP